MSRDAFVILGLTPGHYEPAALAARYEAARAQLLRDLAGSDGRAEAGRRLDELQLAHARLLAAAQRRGEGQSTRDAQVAELRRLIAASIEDGLLRCSRRRAILEEARRIGLSEFQAHLLIAQEQFGGEALLDLRRKAPAGAADAGRVAARLAAAGVLAVALLLGMVHWLSL